MYLGTKTISSDTEMEQRAVHILLLKYAEQPRKATPKERLEEYK